MTYFSFDYNKDSGLFIGMTDEPSGNKSYTGFSSDIRNAVRATARVIEREARSIPDPIVHRGSGNGILYSGEGVDTLARRLEDKIGRIARDLTLRRV